MERSEEYEPIIFDLQKSTMIPRSRQYLFVLTVVGVIVLGAFVTVAAWYYPKALFQNRGLTPATPLPEMTPTVAATTTPVSVVVPPEPTPTPQPAPTVAEPVGMLTLYSYPAHADVIIDGKLLGQTPLRNYPLKPGVYTVKFSHQGNVSEQKITITAGETAEYTHRFQGFASLSIKTTRSGSDIFVNGAFAGQSPLLLEGLVPGTYTIVAQRQGYAAAEQTITLSKGEHREILITIKRLDLATTPDDRKLTPAPRPIHPSERLEQ